MHNSSLSFPLLQWRDMFGKLFPILCIHLWETSLPTQDLVEPPPGYSLKVLNSLSLRVCLSIAVSPVCLSEGKVYPSLVLEVQGNVDIHYG